MNTTSPFLLSLRAADIEADGVAISPDGNLCLRDGEAMHSAWHSSSVKTWVETLAERNRLKWEVADLKRDINAREPHRFIADAIAELEKRATEAGALRGDGGAGKVMWGQAQAYRDAIALLKTYTR